MTEAPGAAPAETNRYDERDHDRFALVPAAYLYFRREGQVLLQLRQGTGYRDGHWACAAAGHVEEGESVVETAVREAREELGVEVATEDVRPLTVLHRGEPGGPAIEQRVDFMFEVTRWTGTPSIQETDKAADLAWFLFVGLPDPVVPHELAVLRAVHDAGRHGTEMPRLLTFGF
ncbi:NUDIX domain-containing protein [Promicromonospora sp. NPDC019610]|uniref:NUDIX domain-containing protein n=1 Tax=Promicromonospora sp. NPDC019610 TaxID=3364405 RepID=UPI003789BBD5